MIRKSLLILAAVGIGLTACTVPTPYNSAALEGVNSAQDARALVQTGMSMEQVRTKLGEPRSIQSFNNQTTWGYAAGTGTFDALSILGAGARIDTRAIIITFNGSGRVSRVDFNRRSV